MAALVTGACDSPREHGETMTGKPQPPADVPGANADADCSELPDDAELLRLLRAAPAAVQAGGLLGGRFEWAAIVNRQGELCSLAVSTQDRAGAWPGSRAIAIAKASTANAFSTDELPLSTARLYTLSQPGHSLWGAAGPNAFNADCAGRPKDKGSKGKVCGGTITFGGGLALYRGKTRIGGLGASGDTACADHEIAKAMRDAAKLNPTEGRGADDIQYSAIDGATIYSHPLCPNTWRDGKKLGDEPVASGY
jgi:uncharacterized protein GlcG (DUF336 family)